LVFTDHERFALGWTLIPCWPTGYRYPPVELRADPPPRAVRKTVYFSFVATSYQPARALTKSTTARPRCNYRPRSDLSADSSSDETIAIRWLNAQSYATKLMPSTLWSVS